MQKLLLSILAIISLLITGCGLHLAYVPPQQQGNMIDQQQLSKLTPGMSRQQVLYLLGNPVLDNALTPDQWDYVAMKQRNHQWQKENVRLCFRNDKLHSIVKNAGRPA